MLKRLEDITGCAIGATDGAIGEVEDIYFDDQSWTARYLVVATGTWLNRRKVLILPRVLGPPDWNRKLLPAAVTMQQVRSAPDIDTNKPVSRQYEWLFFQHYQHPPYWQDAGPPTKVPDPTVPTSDSRFDWSQDHFSQAVAAHDPQMPESEVSPEQHLRSSRVVLGYTVRAQDGEVGHVEGALFAEEDWAIRYLVVRSGHWWSGRRVLLAVQWITSVSWLNSSFDVDLSTALIRGAPPYDPDVPLDRTKEVELFEYYGCNGYWHISSRCGDPHVL